MGRKKSKSAAKVDKPIPYTPVEKTEGEYDVTFTARMVPDSGLKDSGLRTQTSTGALREPDAPAGDIRPRYDLIPAPERSAIMHSTGVSLHEVPVLLPSVWAGDFSDLPGDPGDGLYEALAVIGSAILGSMGPSLQGWKRLATHYARGAIKYSDRNWEKGLETSRTIASLERHLEQAINGETDEDHLAAALWNVIALMFAITRLQDGRYPRELDTYGLLSE